MSKYSENIPREERSYKVLYDNLDIFSEHHVRTDVCSSAVEVHGQMAEGCTDGDDVGGRPADGFSTIVYRADSGDIEYLRRSGLGVSESMFELVMDRLEKEWFLLVQGLINKYVGPVGPATCCDVCTGASDEGDSVLVVCQGCSLVVHDDCYGAQNSGEHWLCRRCLYHESQVSCSFCPSTDGSFKQTSDLKWGHVVCALFNRNLSFGHPGSRDPIDVDSYKEEAGCMFCRCRSGAAISCSYFMCRSRYHVCCGLDKCYFDMNNRISYCTEHDPLKSPRTFGARNAYSLKHFGYEKLRHPPRIRRKIGPVEPRATLFMKLCSLRPVATLDMMQRILVHDVGDTGMGEEVAAICRYWEAKRAAVGNTLSRISLLCPGNEAGRGWGDKRRM